MAKRHLLIIAILYIVGCGYYCARMVAITEPGYPLDDSWIHQVFARNLATGHGFSFNPGVPISAATAPLWPLILIPFWYLMGPIASGIIIGALLQGLALIAVYKLARIMLDNEILAFLSTIFTVIWGAVSGMETGLFSALSLWGMYLFFKSKNQGDRYGYWAYALFTLSFLSRPECALFVAAAFIHDFIVQWRSGSWSFKSWVIKIIIVLLITAPYFIFNYHSTGSLFPRTFSVKVMGNDLISATMRLDFKGIIHALTVYPYFYLQHFYRKVLVPGVIKLISIRGDDRSKRIMFVLLYLLYVPLMGTFSPVLSAVWQNYRYVTNLLPMMIIIGIAGVLWRNEEGLERFKKPSFITSIVLGVAGIFLVFFFGVFSRNVIPYLVGNPDALTGDAFRYLTEVIGRVGLGTLLLAVMLAVGYIYTFPRIRNLFGSGRGAIAVIAIGIVWCSSLTVMKAQFYADNVRNVNECDVDSGKFLARRAEPGDVVAVNDIGAIGYYSGMRIFDLWGLINRAITVQMLNNDSLTFEYMAKNEHVDYMVIAPDWFTYLPKRTDIFHPIAELTTENNTILAEGKNIVYKAYWPDSLNENYRGPR